MKIRDEDLKWLQGQAEDISNDFGAHIQEGGSGPMPHNSALALYEALTQRTGSFWPTAMEEQACFISMRNGVITIECDDLDETQEVFDFLANMEEPLPDGDLIERIALLEDLLRRTAARVPAGSWANDADRQILDEVAGILGEGYLSTNEGEQVDFNPDGPGFIRLG